MLRIWTIKKWLSIGYKSKFYFVLLSDNLKHQRQSRCGLNRIKHFLKQMIEMNIQGDAFASDIHTVTLSNRSLKDPEFSSS